MLLIIIIMILLLAQCITVFSAPNYCDQMGNKGAAIHFGKPEPGCDLVPEFVQFTAGTSVVLYPFSCSILLLSSPLSF